MHAPLLISTMAILEPMANGGQQRIERAHDPCAHFEVAAIGIILLHPFWWFFLLR
jgi:hypothetical protein